MPTQNTKNGYGLVSRLLHWIMALVIFLMFGFGLWMRTLDYYSPWYQQAPHLHQSFGILLGGLLVLRLVWRLSQPKPDDQHLKPIERRLSRTIHLAFYIILAVLMAVGYLISTVDGRALEVFNWFSIPSVYEQKGLEETAGRIHAYIAYFIMALAGLHIIGALKHHFIDHDTTMSRMWHGK